MMSKLADQTTRLLCASVLLGHGGAREKVLEWLKDKNRAVSLELGIDLRLVAQLARFAEARRRTHWLIYTAIFAISLILAAVSTDFFLLGALIAGVFWIRWHVQERNEFAPLFWRGRFNPEEVKARFPAELEAEDLVALPGPDQNFFVYAGFTPFVGAGYDLGGWSVAVALDKPGERFGSPREIEPFGVGELYAAIDEGIDGLNIGSIETADCFFAAGTDIRGNTRFLPDIYGRPVQRLDDAVADQYMYGDDDKVRHYRCYRMLDWGGDIALSYYLRACRRGNTLFFETKRFILTPVASALRAVDKTVPISGTEYVSTILGGFIAGPCMAAVSPIWAYFRINAAFGELFSSEERKRRKLIEKNPVFNYGTATSIRHSLSSGEYVHYFQSIDGDLYKKALEREVLDTLVEFLDAHGIETSVLKENQTTILNTGIMVQGGDVKAGNLAVGAGAQAVKRVQRAFKAKSAGSGGGA